MFNKRNYNHIPTEYEMSNYINNDLWNDFCIYMKDKYKVIPRFEFSKCGLENG